MNKSGTGSTVISHPKGGGAITSLGETFSPDLHTGTGNLSVPIATPPGRAGLQPELTLVYSSGNGNGAFGLGWSLSVPGVSRDTSKSIPRYDDEHDAFLLSGAEQLEPVSSPSPGRTRYRPRTEGLFARVDHVRVQDDYWEVRSRNGLTSLYGHPGQIGQDSAVVTNPDDRRQIFCWHLTQTVDPFGNRIDYEYEREPIQEEGPHRWDQIYLKTIRYGDYGSPSAPQFLVTVDFVYEPRPDPFSIYKAGFEIRTARRCVRIEISTHADVARLAKAYHLIYQDQVDPNAAPANGVSLLQRIEVEGVDGDTREKLPPLEFGYTRFDPNGRNYRALSGVSGSVPERSLAHPDFELADLFGRGFPDVVQIGDTARYWRNLGGNRFDIPRPIERLPSGVRLGDPGVQLADFDGDGHIDLLVSERRFNGYVPLSVAGAQATGRFIQYAAAPPFPLNDPEVRLLDLDGDGITDALRTGPRFELYFHDREQGWNRVETRSRSGFDDFPNVLFSDPRVKLADMSGDGLQDIVYINAGSVDYWPYLGNGRWGRRVAMGGRIRFPDAQASGGIGFDPKRLLLGDVDGDALADLIYVESGRITIWLNQSGNRWSAPIVIHGTPPIFDVDSVRLVDMPGNGTDGILWTYDLQTFGDSTYKFLDLTGGLKPYLLSERNNHAGARTLVEYAPSTRFYLADEALPETRWRTRLPFPVQVVARVEVIDEISGGKLTTEYRYHQGYWDGDEREFRGFGMVEQLDTETFDRYHAAGLHGSQSFNQVEPVHFSPPTLTRTWFHQGQVQDGGGTWSESDYSSTFWPDDPPLFSPEQRKELAQIAKIAAINAEPSQLRHALRALRGSILRTELYALDDSPNSERPYTVTEAQYDVREIEPFEPGADGRLRIFFPFQISNRTTQWERGTEPMTQLSFTNGHDEYGLPHQQLAIAVPRGRNPVQHFDMSGEAYLSTYAITEHARRDDAERYIVDRVARATNNEVLNDGRPSVFELRDAVFSGTAMLRVIGHSRNYYDGEPFVGLSLGQLGKLGALVRSESLAFIDDFLDRTFDPTDPLAVSKKPVYLNPSGVTSWPGEYPAEFQKLLPKLAGYVHYGDGEIAGSPGGYYINGERHRYDFHDPARTPRGLPLATRDPLGDDSTIEYDAFDLLPIRVTDPAGLATGAQYDYRVLQAHEITDANGNTASFVFSPAGFLTAQFVRGKNGDGDGEHPRVRMEYDLLAFSERRQPMFVRSIRRVHHDSEIDVPLEQRDETITGVEYSDGFGRLLQTHTQAEDTLFGDLVFGGNVISADQSVPVTDTVGHSRQPGDPDNVVVSGWQVYDNKGRVVEKYEPFFARGYDFSAPKDSELGQKASIYYDPRGQAIRTVNPDGSEQRVILGVLLDLAQPDNYVPSPWESYTYDANDNAGRTHGDSASAYSGHWNTPASIVLDALGRTVTAVARNGPDPTKDWYITRSSYDIQGNLVSIIDALGRVAFRYSFDLAKRRWRVDSVDAGRRDMIVDALGNLIEGRDSKGAFTLQAYDMLRRPIRLWARDDSAGSVTLRQHLAYGDDSRVDQPPAESQTARAQNLLGQLSRHHDEAGLTVVAAVDFKGNVVDKSRRVIADGPILAVFQNAAANGWQITPFQVDWQPNPQQTLTDREGELLETTAYQTTTSYDALDRIKRVQSPQDVEGKRRELRPDYNRAGGLEQVWLDDTLYVERIAYDAKGQRVLIAYGNGAMTRYAYDPQTFRLNRLRSERYTKGDVITYHPNGGVLQDYGYDYDLVGNILFIRDRAPGSGILNNPEAATTSDPALALLLAKGDALNRRFDYDPIYRLLTATGRECDHPPEEPPWDDQPRDTDLTKARAYTERYNYDPMGSLLRMEHRNQPGGFVREFTVDTANNRIRRMQIGQLGYDYTFDANGNMRSEATSRHFEWNHADQLKAFRTQTDGAEPSVHAHYLYDSASQRVKKLARKQGGQFEVTHYIDVVFEHHRWGNGRLAGENNHVHVVDDKQLVALVRFGPAHPDDKGPAVQFHLGDHLGTSNVVIDSGGALVNREEFTSYGETSFGSFGRKRYRFTGMERDEESGLNYHSARYYPLSLARWLSCDPVGPSQASNLYQYCLGNPIRFGDPTGLQPPSSESQNDQIFRQLDADRNGVLDAREISALTGCWDPKVVREFLTNTQNYRKFTAGGLWTAQDILERTPANDVLDISVNAFARWVENGPSQTAKRQYSDSPYQMTTEQHEDYVGNEEFYGGADIRTGLGFGAVYYGVTHDKGGAEWLNTTFSGVGGAAGDAIYYRSVGQSLAAQSRASIEPAPGAGKKNGAAVGDGGSTIPPHGSAPPPASPAAGGHEVWQGVVLVLSDIVLEVERDVDWERQTETGSLLGRMIRTRGDVTPTPGQIELAVTSAENLIERGLLSMARTEAAQRLIVELRQLGANGQLPPIPRRHPHW
jgi:RHS repeat-associated protein